ncbi:MAG TPA: rhodanese-like domain-containing protein, partial [Planctomycetaceae bacterium]|nr:rhodanese-like domain-containing protein [Planctomycetaceae bacterium]
SGTALAAGCATAPTPAASAVPLKDDESRPMPAPLNAVPIEVTCAHVKARLDAGERFVFLDCREPNEHQTVHLTQAALLPMSEIQNRLTELEPHRQDDVIVHCHHGGRSLKVANWLRQQGFSKAQSMSGGIDQWAVEIDPRLPRY